MNKFENNNNIDDILHGTTILDESITITTILDIIKNLNNRNTIYWHGEKAEYNFIFNDSCTIKEIDKFERHIGCKLPEDYKKFLLYTNGLKLSNIVSSTIFNIQEIYEVKKIFTAYNYPKNLLEISSFHESNLLILIDCDGNINNNLYIHEIMDSDYLYPLGCGFTEFLNRFIITYGSAFWEWGLKNSNKIALN